MVAAAIIGAGVVAGAGTAYAGSSAASATTAASNASISEQQSALQQQAALSAPYRQLGESAMPLYEQLLGIGGPQASGATTPAGGTDYGSYSIGGPGGMNPALGGPSGGGLTGAAGPAASTQPSILQALQATPGYQFTQQQGETGILNAASLSGGLSGNTLASLDQYNTGLASGTYQQVLGDVQGAVGLGQAAAAGQASNIGTAAGNISSTLTNQGNTLAGIDANTAAGITKAIGNTSDQYLTLQALNALNAPAQSPTAGLGG